MECLASYLAGCIQCQRAFSQWIHQLISKAKLLCCAQYVVESFNNSSLFHKALKEAFESFCNKTVAGITSAELMANFCNTLLTKVRSHELL